MNSEKYKLRVIVTACSFALASMSGFAAAQSSAQQDAKTGNTQKNAQAAGSETQNATRQVTEATKVVKRMERDQELKKVLQQAQGVFIVPDYGRAALTVGVRGGEGVVLMKQAGKWSDPAFYNFGGLSAGIQAGAEAGSIVMILNNEKAVKSFKQDNNWSLNAGAGLTVVNWSGKVQGNVGKGDVIVWSDTEGLLGSVALSVTDINFDEDETAAFYGKQVALQDIFSGKVKAPRQVAALKQALPSGSGATSSGSSGSASSAGASGAAATQDPEKSSSGTSGTSGAQGSDASSDTPPYTHGVSRPGQGTTGTGIGGPVDSGAAAKDAESNSAGKSTSGK